MQWWVSLSENLTPVYNADCMLPCAYVHVRPSSMSESFSFFLFSNPSLLEQNLGNLGLHISSRDLLVVAGDLARELQLALARLVDQLVDGVLGQEAADLYLALLTEAVGTVLAMFKSVKLKCAVVWGDKRKLTPECRPVDCPTGRTE